ncbi:DUF4262 domain-containing protein [Acidicapsa dinghuensis]|uniref:DUF4262 domain-containing protein n=1 Tax=Acidicapsa dinghuensis TaxID=2218256 RepID=A0ABW1EJQ8_9BACT|nr:DUF4262 domain-containing protein [Acidicapsa dinghuensis]
MSKDERRERALNQIRENIARNGHHIYVVSGGSCPRFAYTIGLSEQVSFELILAGAILYLYKDVNQIINNIARELKLVGRFSKTPFAVGSQGIFTLRETHSSWSSSLLLGALDYYQVKEMSVVQIVPDNDHWTVDIPDMSEPWSSTTAGAWRWLHESWTYAIPVNSVATTNIQALRGERTTEAARWEENEWEIFAGAGPDVTENEMRVVPLGTLLAADKSLDPIVDLAVGEGLWRDASSDWHPWHSRK